MSTFVKGRVTPEDIMGTKQSSKTSLMIIMIKQTMIVFILLTTVLAMNGIAIETADCLDCHDETDAERHIAYDSSLAMSIHESVDCLDCHAGITDLPHEDELAPVNCGDCHDDVEETYQYHGLLKVNNGGDIPSCADCHGKHDILPIEDRDARVNIRNLPETCGECHANLDLTTKHKLLDEHAVSSYENSVHGRAAVGGAYSAATCNDCHSTDGTAHQILDPSDLRSSVNHYNIPNTCGTCHRGVAADYWEGIHGQEAKRGTANSPVCTDCHGEHGIIAPNDPDSRVSKMRLAEATCTPCHESAAMNEKFDLKGRKSESWIDSYHGMKTQAGDVSVANCASCHGVHRILPQSDPGSSIHPMNLQKTCGSCHEDITEEMANTSIHTVPGEGQSPMAKMLADFYFIMIVVVIGGMLLYCLVDLRKQIKSVVIKKQIIRMFPGELVQHYLLMISFIVLVITGFALRFSDAFWVQWLFGWEGGLPLRGLVHRIAAVVMILTSVWHLIYLLTKKGKSFIIDMLPSLNDIFEFKQMVMYNIGMSKERPNFGRFTYVEKMEYWALVWGTIIMAISGISMWYQSWFATWLPKDYFDIMLVFHYYEAWLATLAILVWHLYSTVFSPAVYPMNPSWIHGRMSGKMFHHEHPGAIPRKVIPVLPKTDESDDAVEKDQAEESKSPDQDLT